MKRFVLERLCLNRNQQTRQEGIVLIWTCEVTSGERDKNSSNKKAYIITQVKFRLCSCTVLKYQTVYEILPFLDYKLSHCKCAP